MLQRYSQVGEYYTMQAPATLSDNAEKNKGFMDILIYDEERDTHARITYEEALLATGLFGPGPTVPDQPPALPATLAGDDKKMDDSDGAMTVQEWVTAAAALNKASKAGTAPTDAQRKAVLCVARPFIEHSMLSAILCVAGADTGATLFGPSDMRTPRIRCRTHVPCVEQRQPHQRWNCFLRVSSQRSRPTRRSRQLKVTTRATSSRSSPSRRTSS